MILDGVFNHCGSFNKWLDRERITRNRKGMRREHMSAQTARIAPISRFFSGRAGTLAIQWFIMTDGGDMTTLPKLELTKIHQKLEAYILRLRRKWVCHRRTMRMAGVWMWQRILEEVTSTITNSGKVP